MPFGPGVLIATSYAAGHLYWQYSFRQVREAIRMEQAGRIDDARHLLRGFLKNRNPLTRRGESKIHCRLLLARLERKDGQYEQAVKEASEVLSSPCTEGIALAAAQVRADALAWGGDLEGALEAARQALDRAEARNSRPQASEIQGLITRILTWQGDLERARPLAEQLIVAGGPARAYGYLRMSEIERVVGNYTGAIEWCRRLMEDSGPDFLPLRRGQTPPAVWTALAHYHGARAAWLSGNAEEAIEWLEWTDGPGRLPRGDAVGWWGLRAAISAEREQPTWKEHLRGMNEAAAAAPAGYGASAWRHYYGARAALARGRFDEAAEGIAEAIRKVPPSEARAEMFYYLGMSLERAGQPGVAGAFACGARQPPAFHFTTLCKQRTAALPAIQ